MEFIDFSHTCSLVNLPVCKLLKSSNTPYSGRGIEIFGLYIPSLSNLILLFSIIICTIRMIITTNRIYSGIGRKELITFFYFYLIFNIIEFLLISEIFINIRPFIQKILVPIEMSLLSTCFFSLLFGSILSPSFFRIKFIDSMNFMRLLSFGLLQLLSFGYFSIFLFLNFLILESKNGFLLFISFFGSNFGISIIYYFLQIIKLYKMKMEIWVYGTLNIAAIFLGISILSLFIGGNLISFISNGYLDALFFYYLFGFCTVIMIHKYWLSICTDEAECAFLVLN